MKLDHIVILVAEMERSQPFYDLLLPLLGLNKVRDHVYANEEGIHLDIKQAGDSSHGYRRHAPGLNHLGFSAPTMQILLDVHAAMQQAGMDPPAIQSFADGSAIFFKDPDGMRIELGFDGAEP